MSTPPLRIRISPHESGSMKAFADATFSTAVGEITIRGYRVNLNRQGALWVGKPQTSYSSQGTTKYKEILDCAKGTEQQIAEAILRAYREHMGMN